MIPGVNVLALAQTVQSVEDIVLLQYAGKTTNAAGLDVQSYNPVNITGSVQAVPRRQYSSMGLDYAKKYIRVWTSNEVKQLERGTGNDRIQWNGDDYEIVEGTDWEPIDGWIEGLFVKIKASA